VPRTRIERIVTGEMGISTDTALRLAHYFKTTPNLWLTLQADYEIEVEAQRLAHELAAIEPRAA
jgi:addiction module HigA family antidote